MAFDFGGLASGIGSLAGIAGDIYSLTAKPPKQAVKAYTGPIRTPGYDFLGGTLTRRSPALASGFNQQRAALSGLQSQIGAPGTGALSNAGINAIRQAAARAAGNLRAQQAKRGVQG